MQTVFEDANSRRLSSLGWCWLAGLLMVLLCWRRASGIQPIATAELQSAVCRVHNQLGGINNLGSGTLIDKSSDGREGLVVTCAHLFDEGTGDILVTFADVGANMESAARIGLRPGAEEHCDAKKPSVALVGSRMGKIVLW